MLDLDLGTLRLTFGSHHTPDEGLCLLEAVAYVAGEQHSAWPECTSKVLGTFGRQLNDLLPDDRRQRLTPLIPALIGTADDGLDQTRGYLALDWLIRTYTPTWMDLAGLPAEASKLRELRRIVDRNSAENAYPTVKHSRAVAWVNAQEVAALAADDAWVDAEIAADDMATLTAEEAAWDAAEAAGWVEPWVNARDAAWHATRVAVWHADAPTIEHTVETLQDPAIDLLRRMARPS